MVKGKIYDEPPVSFGDNGLPNNKLIQYSASPHVGGVMLWPSLIVIHYTASGGADASGDVSWFRNPQAKVSAHFVVGRDGGIVQCVPVNRVAWHAGKSIWKGKNGCNAFSIGIEVDNWGILTKRADGKFYSHTGVVIPDDKVVEINGRYWEVFPDEQVRAVGWLVRSLRGSIRTLQDIAGHRDIAPGRKVDPGDAWDMQRMLTYAEDRYDDVADEDAETNKVIKSVRASRLNIRVRPDIAADTIGQFSRNTYVTVHYTDGAWSYVHGEASDGCSHAGWVSSEFLV
jgi:N-acetylmuramoyl-L-alanine amidase